MLLKLNNRFINFFNHYKLHITEASTVQCTQECSIIFGGPTYAAIAYQICKDHYYIGLDVLKYLNKS